MNVPDREAMMELVAAYALGVLPDSEHPAVAAFIAQNEDARDEFRALRSTADLVGLVAEAPVDADRSARMKQRLMTTVRAQSAARNVRPIGAPRPVSTTGPGRSSFAWGSGIAVAAAIAFALVSTIQNFSLRSDLANANARTASLAAQIAQNEHVRSRDHEMVADLFASDAKRFPVPQGDVIEHGTRIYLALRSLPPLPKGKTYQAWTLAKGAKTVSPSVTFVPSASGVAVVALPENAENLQAVALSVEPEGGSKAPTTKPAFLRPLS